MTETFDPGPQWREVGPGFEMPPRREVLTLATPGGTSRMWVREAPVPPLPTEPYTVIRVTWRDPEYLTGSHIYTLSSDGYWSPQNRNAPAVGAVELGSRITGFEVLAEPRAVTAKAVLDRLRQQSEDPSGAVLYGADLDVVAREFEATPQ